MENIFVEFLPPWVETGLQPAFYDKESGTVLQQTARMYARVNMLIRMFNKLSRNTKNTVEDYINRFNELYTYVHDYFDNLDVQEEINNKLDDMTEDGTLQSILLNYTTTYKVYATTRDMIEDYSILVSGMRIKTLGYYNINDGGGAEYLITDSEPSKYHIVLGDGSLYALLITSNVNVDQLGANGGNYDLSEYFDSLEDAQKVYPNATDLNEKIGGVAIQCAINYFHDYTIYLNSNTYYKNTQLTNGTYTRICLIGNARWKSIIKETDTSVSENNMLELNIDSKRSNIENIEFIGPYEMTDTAQATLESYNTNGIVMNGATYTNIKNCVFRQCKRGIKLHNSWTNIFEDCYFARCNYGVDCSTSSNCNDIEINHCFVEYNNHGFCMGEGRNQMILNCDVEKNNVDGVFKQNEGDIQIISSYFEDDINIEYGTTYVRNVLIQGCAFYQNSTNDDFYNFINYNGLANKTKITIQSCNFIDGNENSTGVAIKEKNNSGNLHPILIENTTTNLKEFIIDRFKGIHINNGVINNYSFNSYQTNYIYGSDGGSKTLAINGINSYRIDLFTSGTYSIIFPTIPESEMCCDHTIKFVVPGYNTSASNGQYSLVPDDASTCNVSGQTTIDKNDIGKEITARLVAYKNGRSYWNIAKSA